MKLETITIEQSAATQIGESITCWLAQKLENNKGEIRASVSIKCHLNSSKRIIAEFKAKELVEADCMDFEIIVEDPNQMKLPLNKE